MREKRKGETAMTMIADLNVDRFRLPLPEPIEASAAGVMSAFDMVAARITDDDGVTGVGYTVCHAGQGGSIASLLDGPFREILMGEDPDLIEGLWHRMYKACHYMGRGGPVSFALAAADVALWDMKGRRLGQPLWRLMGGAQQTVRTYAGNIDLNFPVEKLIAGGLASVEAGFHSVKMRFGRPTLAEDLARAEAMRDALPDEIEMMADANEAWRVDEAMRAMRDLQRFDLVWLEEPTIPDDYPGHARIQTEGGLPVATGENLHSIYEFQIFTEIFGSLCSDNFFQFRIFHIIKGYGLFYVLFTITTEEIDILLVNVVNPFEIISHTNRETQRSYTKAQFLLHFI